MRTNLLHPLIVLLCFAVAPAPAQIKALAPAEKHRIVLLTDIGGDHDDEQSFTRFMMYANQYDIEGLIATSIRIFPKEEHRPLDGDPQPQYIRNWIEGYRKVRPNLLKHSEGWPDPDHLLTLIRKGVKTGRDAPFNIRTGKAGKGSGHYPLEQLIGENKDTGATKLIIEAVDRDDPRPVWVPIWGGSVELAQALWRVRNDRSDEEVKKFVSKLRVYSWGLQDSTGVWIKENFPDLNYLVSTGGVIYSAPPELHSAEWLNENVRFDHGALGELCPLRHGKLGGADTETYLGLIPNGLSNMEHPNWGGWGGRLRKAKGSDTQWVDIPSNILPARLGHTISRWATHFQNDYEARMDWCVKDFIEANHPPTPVLNGDESTRAIEVSAKPGERITLDATASSDIDGDSLNYQWQFFPEAGTYKGQVAIENADQAAASFVVPQDGDGKVLHVILTLTDEGNPSLTRYRRLVVNCSQGGPFPIKVGQNPESITKGFGGNYYVTVMGGKEEGDAQIVEISQDGNTRVFAAGFDQPKGIAFVNNHLYFSDVTKVWKVDQEGTASVFADKQQFPKEVLYLNDVAVDADGQGIYVVDMGATSFMRDEDGNLWPLDSAEAKRVPQKGRIYHINLNGQVTIAQDDSPLMLNPNGVGLDNDGNIMVGAFFLGNFLVKQNGKLSPLKGQFRGADAVEQDSKGDYYVSSWSQGKVWKIDGKTQESTLLIEGLQSAADFYLEEDRQRLLLPDMKSGFVHAVEIGN